MTMKFRGVALAAFLAFSGPAFAQPTTPEVWVTGTASVIDGDSIEIDGSRIRLFGIDAPEPDQTCYIGNLSRNCGIEATDYLSDMIYGETVRCRVEREDHYGRLLSNCLWGKRNVNEIMVLTGNAVALRRHTEFYVETERKAQAARAGIWATDFTTPEEWRAAKQRQKIKAEERAAKRR